MDYLEFLNNLIDSEIKEVEKKRKKYFSCSSDAVSSYGALTILNLCKGKSFSELCDLFLNTKKELGNWWINGPIDDIDLYWYIYGKLDKITDVLNAVSKNFGDGKIDIKINRKKESNKSNKKTSKGR